MQWKKRNETRNFFRHGVSFFCSLLYRQSVEYRIRMTIPVSHLTWFVFQTTLNAVVLCSLSKRESLFGTRREVAVQLPTLGFHGPWNFHRISFCLNARVTNQKICLSYPSCLKCILLCYPREIRPKNDECEIWICDLSDFFLLLKFFLEVFFPKSPKCAHPLWIFHRHPTHALPRFMLKGLGQNCKMHSWMLSLSDVVMQQQVFCLSWMYRRDRLAVLLLFKTFPQNKIEKSRGKNEDNPLARHRRVVQQNCIFDRKLSNDDFSWGDFLLLPVGPFLLPFMYDVR